MERVGGLRHPVRGVALIEARVRFLGREDLDEKEADNDSGWLVTDTL